VENREASLEIAVEIIASRSPRDMFKAAFETARGLV
jgi:hypothetical protein